MSPFKYGTSGDELVGSSGEKDRKGMSMIDKVREVALKVLYEIDKKGAFSNIALDEALRMIRGKSHLHKMDARDFGFISEIVYGTVSWRLTIDEVIQKYSNIRMKKLSSWILNILRMGVYQILFLDRVPKSAVVNESVNLAKKYGHQASSRFVNAVLRKVSKKDYDVFFRIDDDIERISKTTSMPVWLVEKLLEQNSLERVEQICKDSNVRPKLYVRINRLKEDGQELIKVLEEDGIKVEKQEEEDFLVLSGAKNIESFASYQEGRFSVQDKAAGYIPIILDPKPNEKVLDACSSPGGKTTYMAERMKNRGEIYAWDLYEHRIKLVEQAIARLGIVNVKTQVKDARIYDENYFEFFDKILLDVPCLGIGVLKRKPDIKWQRKKEDIEEITKIQKEILETCSKYLKLGGELVYATCSILKEENEWVIEEFLKKHTNFKIQKIVSQEEKEFVQIFQNEKTDGFFICKMRKI